MQGKSANFQITSACNDGKNIFLKMAGFYFFARQDTTKFLWMTFPSFEIKSNKKK